MTKKFGEHSLDRFIGTTGTVGKKYEAQRKGSLGSRYEVATIKEARELVSYEPSNWRLAADIGRTEKVHPNQPRPPAKAAAKEYVPKKGVAKPKPVAAKPTPVAQPWPRSPLPAGTWPFPVAVKPAYEQAMVNGVRIELEPGLKIEYVGPLHIKIKKG